MGEIGEDVVIEVVRGGDEEAAAEEIVKDEG